MIYNCARGYHFEDVINNFLLANFKDTNLKVYRQVPLNGNSCRIDFVITEEMNDKTKLDLSKSVILSTKTVVDHSSSWREDQHLYDKCKAYFFVSFGNKVPTQQTPDNVFFVSPNREEETEKALKLDSLVPKIISMFSH